MIHLRARRFGGQVAIALLMLVFANPIAARAQGGCPSSNIADVLKDPRVQDALDDAWEDSHEGQPDEHEEGGWIYQCQSPNVITGDVRYYTDVRRWPSGSLDGIHPTAPLLNNDACRLVADFHTHPGSGITESGRPDNPSADGFGNWRASGPDRLASAEYGLPGIIRYGSGDDTTDFTYGYNGMEEPRDPSWTCPGGDAHSAWGTGDPHLKTLDGYTYDFQAIGTFTYLATSPNDFVIQVQQQAYKNLRYAAVNSAIAVRDGGDRIEWSIDWADPRLNGVPRPIAVGSEVRLRGRGILRRTPDGYVFQSSVGDRLIVSVSSDMVDFYLRPANHRRGKVRGMLGNFDGDRDNDFKTADGKVIQPYGGVMDFNHPLYAEFGSSWRVAGAGLVSRVAPVVPNPLAFPEREPERSAQLMTEARAKCEASGVTHAEARDACAFDLATTGNDAFVRSAAKASLAAVARERALGVPLALNAEASGALNGREARSVYTIKLTPGTYLFESTGSERTSWTLEGPNRSMLLNAEQGRVMGDKPVRVTIPAAGLYRITVSVRWEMLDGSYRIRVRQP